MVRHRASIKERAVTADAGETVENEIATLATRYVDAWNKHDLDGIMALHAADTTYQMDGQGPVYRGKIEVRATFERQLASVSDLRFELKSLFLGRDHIVFEASIAGIRRGSEPLNLCGIDLITVRDGAIADKHSYAVAAR
jgi:ketosteroid isomerase-like protein